jgi:hypothetical protein
VKRLGAPSGHLPPDAIVVGGERVDLTALAEAVTERFFAEFPDEHDRYGDAGREWCRHDTQWVYVWAAGELARTIDIVAQTAWLARVLAARDYPVQRLERSLELAADVAERSAPSLVPPLRVAAAALAQRRPPA